MRSLRTLPMPRTVYIRTHDKFYDRRTDIRFEAVKVEHLPGSRHEKETVGVARDVPDDVAREFYADDSKWCVMPPLEPEAPTAEVKAEAAFDARIAETAEQLAPVAAAAVAEHRAAKKGHK